MRTAALVSKGQERDESVPQPATPQIQRKNATTPQTSEDVVEMLRQRVNEPAQAKRTLDPGYASIIAAARGDTQGAQGGRAQVVADPSAQAAPKSSGTVVQCVPNKKKKITTKFTTTPAVKGGVKKKAPKYGSGMHGAKKQEQQRLSKQFGITVSGSSHESEHTIGFEPLNQTSGLKRGTAGRARELENTAPAYQEVRALHRDHIGTGTHSTAGTSGYTSQEYRDAQRGLIESGDISSAVQINQLGYAFDPNFQASATTAEGKAANASFDTMVENMSNFTYAQGTNDVKVPVTPEQQVEMYLARRAAQTGVMPTRQDELDAMEKFGVD